jgi:hypothetical protein
VASCNPADRREDAAYRDGDSTSIMSPPDPLRLPKSAMPLNTKSPGVRRILEEAKEIQADPSVDFVAVPSEVPSSQHPSSSEGFG